MRTLGGGRLQLRGGCVQRVLRLWWQGAVSRSPQNKGTPRAGKRGAAVSAARVPRQRARVSRIPFAAAAPRRPLGWVPQPRKAKAPWQLTRASPAWLHNREPGAAAGAKRTSARRLLSRVCMADACSLCSVASEDEKCSCVESSSCASEKPVRSDSARRSCMRRSSSRSTSSESVSSVSPPSESEASRSAEQSDACSEAGGLADASLLLMAVTDELLDRAGTSLHPSSVGVAGRAERELLVRRRRVAAAPTASSGLNACADGDDHPAPDRPSHVGRLSASPRPIRAAGPLPRGCTSPLHFAFRSRPVALRRRGAGRARDAPSTKLSSAESSSGLSRAGAACDEVCSIASCTL